MDSVGEIFGWFVIFASILSILVFMIPGFIAGRRYAKTPEYQASRKRTTNPNQSPRLKPPPGTQKFELATSEQAMSPKIYKAGDFFRIDISGMISLNTAANHYATLVDAHFSGKESQSPSLWKPHNCLYFDDSSIPAVPFEIHSHLHRYSFLYVGTGERLTIFLEKPKSTPVQLWRIDGSLSIKTGPLTNEDVRKIRQQGPAEAVSTVPEPSLSPEDDAEKVRAEQQLVYACRAYTLSHTFENSAYADDAWVESYGKKYCDDLLKRKKDIIAAHLEFHADQHYVEYLMDKAPGVYKRATWEHRALAAAERYIVECTERKRPVPTPEQFRERMMRRLQVQAQDHIRRAVEVETAVQQYRHTLEELDLDEEEIEEKLQLFKDILTDEGGDNGSFVSV
jgi:hypothetical protein